MTVTALNLSKLGFLEGKVISKQQKKAFLDAKKAKKSKRKIERVDVNYHKINLICVLISGRPWPKKSYTEDFTKIIMNGHNDVDATISFNKSANQKKVTTVAQYWMRLQYYDLMPKVAIDYLQRRGFIGRGFLFWKLFLLII